MKFGVRVNKLKSSQEEIQSRIQNLGGSAENISWYESGLVVEGPLIEDLMKTDEYTEGKFYVQNISSMIPALVLNPSSEDAVLDLCAAPGSKTTQLAELMGNVGEITANDVSRERMYKLRANLKRLGIENITTLTIPGEAFGRKYSEVFDKVLVDVPCSMGQDYAPKNLKRLIHRQRNLLRSGFNALKVGGVLVYSTCSPRHEENEAVVEWLLKRTPTAVLDTPLLDGMPKEWNVEKKWIRIETTEATEHFFVARIEKIEE